jgi:hypothetical protein
MAAVDYDRLTNLAITRTRKHCSASSFVADTDDGSGSEELPVYESEGHSLSRLHPGPCPRMAHSPLGHVCFGASRHSHMRLSEVCTVGRAV